MHPTRNFNLVQGLEQMIFLQNVRSLYALSQMIQFSTQLTPREPRASIHILDCDLCCWVCTEWRRAVPLAKSWAGFKAILRKPCSRLENNQGSRLSVWGWTYIRMPVKQVNLQPQSMSWVSAAGLLQYGVYCESLSSCIRATNSKPPAISFTIV